MQDFKKLSVWKKAHELTLSIYKVTGQFPNDERFGLTNQIRRASASIPANIAEGCGRGSSADFARFLQMAMGSASEVEYHLILAKDIGYLQEQSHRLLEQGIVEIKRMLTSLIGKVRATDR